MVDSKNNTRKNIYPIDDFEGIASHLRIIPSKSITGRDHYEVREAFTIEDKEGNQFSFPQYFSSNGGDIPLPFRMIVPCGGRALPAYLIHDWYCDKANRSGSYQYREIGDNYFYQHLRDCGYAKWRAKPMSIAVKKYGEYLKASGKLK